MTAARNRRHDEVPFLRFGADLTTQWLPTKKLQLAANTAQSYERNVQRYILPAPGRIGLRRSGSPHSEALYDRLLTSSIEKPGRSPKTACSSVGLAWKRLSRTSR